jgi:uncharacterized protein YegP (UPF0339 family)
MTLGTANNLPTPRQSVRRMPRIVYSWVTIRPSKRSKKPVRVECVWALKGANGEHMVGSFPEGYRDKADARRAVRAVMAIFGAEPLASVDMYAKEIGPGPRPKDDEVTP